MDREALWNGNTSSPPAFVGGLDVVVFVRFGAKTQRAAAVRRSKWIPPLPATAKYCALGRSERPDKPDNDLRLGFGTEIHSSPALAGRRRGLGPGPGFPLSAEGRGFVGPDRWIGRRPQTAGYGGSSGSLGFQSPRFRRYPEPPEL